MMLNFNSMKPIYLQLADWTEDEILADRLKVGDKIFSQIEYSNFFQVNALTAARGVAVLEQKGIVEKRRGVGMFVTKNAKAIITKYRKTESLIDIVDDMWKEIKKLNMTEEDLLLIIKEREKFND